MADGAAEDSPHNPKRISFCADGRGHLNHIGYQEAAWRNRGMTGMEVVVCPCARNRPKGENLFWSFHPL
jgi:hypothetical protein